MIRKHVPAPRRRRSTLLSPRRKFFVAVAGNIGSGKSSLTRLLSERLGWIPMYESVEDNPYLSDFYADMHRWSFALQVYFLSNRFRSHKAITEGKTSVVLDRVIYEDAEIFAQNLYDMGSMEERDHLNYRALYDVMTEFLQPPDLLIYLRASVETLRRQIALRGRDFEQGIETAYLERLNAYYERWIAGYRLGRVLVVESDRLDFVNREEDLKGVMRRIRESLKTGKVARRHGRQR